MNTEEKNKSEVALREEEVLKFWKEHDIFNKSMETPAGSKPVGDFVFYDGPPFATGLPHYGHILASTIKDAIPRFWTMNGYRVRRKWGWDCHGLPLENLIEKKLGLSTKRDIEEYGVKNFNEAARGAVLEYADDWKEIIPRMGRWADMENDYKTMDATYTESVWWVFKSLYEKGLVYEGFKSMHLCPRCGTTLSNFEVNQGYQDIKDISVYVPLPLVDEPDTALLVWTTTPWTLPGNMAAAVHNDHDYVTVAYQEEGATKKLIVAKERAEAVFAGVEYKVVAEMKGADLVGKSYLPPFEYYQDMELVGKDKAWQVYHADYVELGEEGTGLVHLAPAYGDDDMKLAQAHGVPVVHHVDDTGHFMPHVTDFAGQLVKPKDDDESGVTHLDADIEIVKALKARDRLFKKENITHSYPHCWRCDTPLLNYATTSWFVEVTKIKDELVAENNKVHWVPENVGKNRFGKWLEGARDWAVSRQRYWGAPLPVWRNPETKDIKVFGSVAELQEYVPKSGNSYLVMRHGESESNVLGKVSALKENKDPITEKGKEQVLETAKNLPRDIDMIIHSGFERTRMTAEVVAHELGVEEIIEDDRIAELDISSKFEGKTWDEYNAQYNTFEERYTKKIAGIENRRDTQIRAGKMLFEIEQKYKNKKILFVGHGGTLFGLNSAAKGFAPQDAENYRNEEENPYFLNAEVKELPFSLYPHNENYELDFHRPYIDDVELFEGEIKLERVPDVFDCWFESGSMPYGQHHHPFENADSFQTEHFPAQFIAEGLDQTRGWFYSLIVLGTALFGKSPYENVIVNGLVLAEDGKKMSKKLQNYPDPVELVERQGADAMRYYLLSSPIVHGEDLNFSEKEVQELQRKNIGRLHNVLAMYEMFADGTEAVANSQHVLDRWIIARLNELITESTTGYKNYELDKANRPIADFIDDLSVWYLRRSRDRLKGMRKSGELSQEAASDFDGEKSRDNLNSSGTEDVADKAQALGTLRHVLQQLSLVMAPAMPFYAEYLWQRVKDDNAVESVHLGAWPQAGEVDSALLTAMQATREVVREALQARVAANIKVRQPVASVSGPALAAELQTVVLDELNAKNYKVAEDTPVAIDTALTADLIEEGQVREFMRAIQEMRKEGGFEPSDVLNYQVDVIDKTDIFFKKHWDAISAAVGLAAEPGDSTGSKDVSKTIVIGDMEFPFRIWKS